MFFLENLKKTCTYHLYLHQINGKNLNWWYHAMENFFDVQKIISTIYIYRVSQKEGGFAFDIRSWLKKFRKFHFQWTQKLPIFVQKQLKITRLNMHAYAPKKNYILWGHTVDSSFAFNSNWIRMCISEP